MSNRWKTLIATILGITGITITITVNVNIEDVTPVEDRMGWTAPTEQQQAEIDELIPDLVITEGQQGQRTIEPTSSEGAVVHLWDPVLRIRKGEHLPTWRQETGDCVSMGSANAIWYLQHVQYWKNAWDTSLLKKPYPPYIYGVSRVMPDLGNKRLGSSAGSNGGWAAYGVKKYGVLPADFDDVPAYSGDVANTWGVRGPPQKFIEYAKDYCVQAVAKVTSYEDVRDAIANGYPVTVASNQGFQMQPRLYEGKKWGIPSGSWAHQMCFLAVDDTARAPNGKTGGVYCLNSWGANAHGEPAGTEPPGGFWVDRDTVERMVRQNDSYAYSQFDGFPAQELDFNVFGDTPVTVNKKDEDTMKTMWTLFGLSLIAAGGVGLMTRHPARTLAATLLIGLSLCCSSVRAEPLCFDVFCVNTEQLRFDVFEPQAAVIQEMQTLNFNVFEGETPPTEDFGDMVDQVEEDADEKARKVEYIVYAHKPGDVTLDECPPCKRLDGDRPRLLEEYGIRIVWQPYMPAGEAQWPHLRWKLTDGSYKSNQGYSSAADLARKMGLKKRESKSSDQSTAKEVATVSKGN
ncbi:MAG: hypothetical protein CMJ46_03205 [Planctomyces sp.]|nr:hypothetical protein [Planctomyces sp.]